MTYKDKASYGLATLYDLAISPYYQTISLNYLTITGKASAGQKNIS